MRGSKMLLLCFLGWTVQSLVQKGNGAQAGPRRRGEEVSAWGGGDGEHPGGSQSKLCALHSGEKWV